MTSHIAAACLLTLLACSSFPSTIRAHGNGVARGSIARAPAAVLTQHGKPEADDVAHALNGDDNRESVAADMAADVIQDDLFDDDVSKRKWGEVDLQAWGKRKWSATNGLSAWGKRDQFHNSGNDEGAAKRKWGDRQLTAWGKRQPEMTSLSHKRRWGADNGMRAWGKRVVPRRSYVPDRYRRSMDGPQLMPYFVGDDDEDDVQLGSSSPLWVSDKRQWRQADGEPKRTWELNTMKTWGKRHHPWPASISSSRGPKRAWSSDNSLRIWG